MTMQVDRWILQNPRDGTWLKKYYCHEFDTRGDTLKIVSKTDNPKLAVMFEDREQIRVIALCLKLRIYKITLTLKTVGFTLAEEDAPWSRP